MTTLFQRSTATVALTRKLIFRPPFHEPRIYENAPPGVHVTTIHAYDPDLPRKVVTYVLLEVRNYNYFALDETSGNLTTKQIIDKEAGQSYQVIIVAVDNGKSELKHLDISVTKFNEYPPKFEQNKYRGEIHIDTSLGTSVIRVTAHDNDSVPQNAEVYYRMDRNISSKYFQLHEHTGELTLYVSLNDSPKHLFFSVFAEDGGSPKRWAQAEIELLVKTISEPLNVSVTNITESSAKICWYNPLYGITQGYIVSYHEVSIDHRSPLITNITSSETILCTVLKNLRSWTEHLIYVSGWNPDETGQSSEKKRFTTRPDFCSLNICKNGKCLKISEEPGYFCQCSEGYYGKVCDMFNPCSIQPCDNYGSCHNTSHNEYSCECLPGFSGDNCSDFNPCAIRPSPCKNGATCIMLASRTFECNCAMGYYGKICQNFNPCSSSPCLNNGVCHNISDVEYECICIGGYFGKWCELDIDECMSSPCHNEGSCINNINSFTCYCPLGFYGNICEKIEHCRPDTVETEKGIFNWTSTKHDMMVLIKCPFGPIYSKDNDTEGYAKRTCQLLPNGIVEWNEMDIENCQAKGFREAEELADKLQSLTKDPNKVTPKDFQQAANQIEVILQYAIFDHKLASGMMAVISNMLAVNNNVYESGDEDGIITKRLLKVIDMFASNVKLNVGDKVNFYTENIVVQALLLDTLKQSDDLNFSLSFDQRKEKRELNIEKDSEFIFFPSEELYLFA